VFSTAFESKRGGSTHFSCREKHFLKKTTILCKKSSIIEVLWTLGAFLRHLE
jgi:hypothetical protein